MLSCEGVKPFDWHGGHAAQTRHLGLRATPGWKESKGRCRKGSDPPKGGPFCSQVRGALSLPGNRGILTARLKDTEGIWSARPCWCPHLPLWAPARCSILSFHDPPLLIKPTIKTLRLISPWRLPCHVKLSLNKSICFSLIALLLWGSQLRISEQSEETGFIVLQYLAWGLSGVGNSMLTSLIIKEDHQNFVKVRTLQCFYLEKENNII